MTLRDADLSELYRSADAASVKAQRSFLLSTRLRLFFAVLAAVFASFATKLKVGEHDVLSYAAAVAFVAALAIEIWLLGAKPEQDWYDGRALAESAKTLAWRFAVGGQPFFHNDHHAETYLEQQLADLLEDAPSTRIVPKVETGISPALRDLRAQPREARKQVYLEGRVRDQERWYAGKAAYNRAASRRWKFFLILTESAGAVAAVLTADRILDVDLTSIASTVVGIGVAWLAVKQHDQLERAYTFASHELAIVAARLEDEMNEHEWAVAVSEAEEAISREHTMWRASHVVPNHSARRRVGTHLATQEKQ
jgi:hypothetical protein